MAHKKRRQAGKSLELKITKRMLEAGEEALAGFNPEFERYEDRVARIFKAMVQASGKAVCTA